jgi:hypothetical protein
VVGVVGGVEVDVWVGRLVKGVELVGLVHPQK